MPGARPTKYTDEKAASICQRLRAGSSRKDAAESLGITYVCFWQWLQKRPDFAAAVMEAEASCMVKMAALVVKAAENDPKYALEVLKRRRPDEWGDRLNLSNKSDDDLLNEAADIVKRAGTGGAGGSGPARAESEDADE